MRDAHDRLISRNKNDISSLLTGIKELTRTRLVRSVDKTINQDLSSSSSSGKSSRTIDEKKKSNNLEENSSCILVTSTSSSASSLKRRLRDLPSASETRIFSDRLAALDRRVRREREIYLQLHGLNETIDEKDEIEASSSMEILTRGNSTEKFSYTVENYLNDARAQKRAGMCSSAPETMRIENKSCPKTVSIGKIVKQSGLKKFEEPRPPKYLRPIESRNREILRCNAPPLCLSNEKIVQLLRRGSASARQENSQRTTKRNSGKLAAYGKLTGVIIKNLSSESEDDDKFPDDQTFQGASFLRTQNFTNKKTSKDPRKEVLDEENFEPEISEEMKISKDPGFSRSEKSIYKRLLNGERHLNESRKIFDRPESSKSGKSIYKVLLESDRLLNDEKKIDPQGSSRSEKMEDPSRTSIDQLKYRLKNLDSKKQGSWLVPRLEIESRELSQSTSITSGDNTTKRSLDVNELIKALSDVSIEQQKILDHQSCNNFAISKFCNSERTSYNSTTNDNGLSTISTKKTEWMERKNGISKNPIASKISDIPSDQTGDQNCTMEINSPQKMAESSKRSQTNLISPKVRKLEDRKSPKDKLRIRTFRVKKNFQSYNSLTEDHEKNVRENKTRSSRNGEFSVPVTFRKRDEISNNSSLENESSEEIFKYLQRSDSKIPYSRRSRSLSSEKEEREEAVADYSRLRRAKKVENSSNQEETLWKVKNLKFNIYEDTRENSLDASTEELNKASLTSSLGKSHEGSELKLQGIGYLGISSTVSEIHEEDTKNHQSSEESKHLFWADNESNLNRLMTSSFDSEIENCNRDISGSRSCLISSRTSSSKNKSISINSPKELSLLSSSVTPRYQEDARRVSENLTAKFENIGTKKNMAEDENIFSSSYIAKRLSYTEIPEPEVNDRARKESSGNKNACYDKPEVSGSDESVEDFDSSPARFVKFGKSESAVDAFQDSSRRGKLSSSLSRLKNSPEVPGRKVTHGESRRKSQDRFPFTIIDGNSSSNKLPNEIANRATSGCKTLEHSETGYRLTNHTSLRRITNRGTTLSTVGMTNGYEKKHRRFVPKIRKFVGQLSRWRRSKRCEEKSGDGTTRILYENKNCDLSGEESTRSTEASTNKRERRCNRDGLWVVGLDEREIVDYEKIELEKLGDCEKCEQEDRYSMFLVNDINRSEILNRKFNSKNPINSVLHEEPEVNLEGCFCIKICRFLIGSNDHRYSLDPSNF